MGWREWFNCFSESLCHWQRFSTVSMTRKISATAMWETCRTFFCAQCANDRNTGCNLNRKIINNHLGNSSSYFTNNFRNIGSWKWSLCKTQMLFFNSYVSNLSKRMKSHCYFSLSLCIHLYFLFDGKNLSNALKTNTEWGFQFGLNRFQILSLASHGKPPLWTWVFSLCSGRWRRQSATQSLHQDQIRSCRKKKFKNNKHQTNISYHIELIFSRIWRALYLFIYFLELIFSRIWGALHLLIYFLELMFSRIWRALYLLIYFS